MGVLCELFSATESDVNELQPEDIPSRRFGGVEAKGLNPVPFAALHHILTGIDIQESVRLHSLVAEITEDGPWIYRLPRELASTLAELSQRGIDSVAAEWTKTDELQLAGWSYDDVNSVRSRMVALCQHPDIEGMTIFLWSSIGLVSSLRERRFVRTSLRLPFRD